MNMPKLIISLNEDGSVTVTGPIGDKLLCYGLLESAKDAIRDHVAKTAEERRIEIPKLSLVTGKDGGGHAA